MMNRVSDVPTATTREAGVDCQPRTQLGRLLCKIQGKILASGEPLLSWDEIEREVGDERRDPAPQE
jgi:hypothetical protein